MDAGSYLSEGLIDYYEGKLSNYPDSPRSVDWKDLNAQTIRFEILSELIQSHSNYSLNDLGCGLGDYYSYLETKYEDVKYHGFDISNKMIDAARMKYKNRNADFNVSSKPLIKSDYTVASGIFSVAPNANVGLWEERNFNVIETMWHMSNRGIAFNMLSNLSHLEKRAPHLYYADAGLVVNHLLSSYNCELKLIFKPELYEFSILMWRNS